MIRAVLPTLGLLLLVSPPAPAARQAAPGGGEVRVEALVHDEGTPIRLPSPEGLQLFVDEEPQSFDWTPDEPLSVAVVMDLSSSVTGARLEAAASGIAALFASLDGDDRCALVSFTRSVELHAGWDGTCADAAAAAGELRSGGPSALNNALTLTLGLLANAPGRPVLVVFTDGVDGASWTRDSWPLVAAAGHTPLVFAVTAPAARGAGGVGGVYGSVDAEELANQIVFEGRNLQDRGRDLRGLRNTDPFWALAELTRRSAGALTRTAGDPEEIEEALGGILAAVRERLSLRFTPSPALASGWHALRVESPDGDVLHRTGFVGR